MNENIMATYTGKEPIKQDYSSDYRSSMGEALHIMNVEKKIKS